MMNRNLIFRLSILFQIFSFLFKNMQYTQKKLCGPYTERKKLIQQKNNLLGKSSVGLTRKIV